MPKEVLKEANEQQLRWFWNITTKWYFFPLLLLIFGMILATQAASIEGRDEPLAIILVLAVSMIPGAIYFMPKGLLFFVGLIFGIRRMTGDI